MNQLLENIYILQNREKLINELIQQFENKKTRIVIMKLNGQFSDFFRKKPVTTGKIAIVNAGWNVNNPGIGGGGINGLFEDKIQSIYPENNFFLVDINYVIRSKIANSCIGDCYICEWNNKQIIDKIGDIMLYVRGPVPTDNFKSNMLLLCKNMAAIIVEYNKDKSNNDKITTLRLSSIGTGVALGGKDPEPLYKTYMYYILVYLADIGLEFIELSSEHGKGWYKFNPENNLNLYSEDKIIERLKLLEKNDIIITPHNIKTGRYDPVEFLKYDIDDPNIKTLVIMRNNALEISPFSRC